MTVLDKFRLDGKVAVVTGASSGLGVAIAQALAEAGADVALGARRVDRLPATGALVEAAGRRWIGIETDVTKPEDCTALVAAAVEQLGGVDVLINNAGVASAVPGTRETPEQFSRVVDVNLHGTYWMAQAFARVARPGGAIVNLSSVLGLRSMGLPQAAYASSKAGVIGLTRDLAAQWTARKGIRVNCVAPGFFPSEMTDEMDPKEGELVKMLAPAGRFGDPAELAAAVVFLASDASSYITGVTLPVDGGLVMP
ncbi:MAG: glucose 1-dehydrogenase [Mycobacteriales bacterium]|nr:glucose 1-dehydrogenase [Mycobacteriales bacterium]